jgi:hypothetical protein
VLESVFRGKIENLLLQASWSDDLREAIGLRGVSQIWSGKPAWYFWLTGPPCAYALQLESCWNDGLAAAGEEGGLFSIKCFPNPDAPFFQDFSHEEQALVLSDRFDATGTPCFESLDRMSPSLFNAASIEYACAPDEQWTLLTLEGLNLMRTRYEVDATVSNELIGRTVTWSAGEVARKIPSWDLGYGLFDRLISLYAYHHRTSPVRVFHTSSPGFEVVYDESRAYTCKELPDVSALSLAVLFAKEPSTGLARADAFIQSGLREEGRTVLFDETFACGCANHRNAAISKIPLLNGQWWKSASENYLINPSSCCCCS